MAATLSPILAANTIYLKYKQPDWNMDFTDVALLTGWHLLGVAVAGFFFVPTSRVWGKRHAYIIGTLILIASCAWGGAAQSYKSLVWARVFQGFAVAPFEALVNASVGDMYPVHQRGKRMAFTNFALYGGAFLTPVIVGKLTAVMGWRWVFYWVAIAGAVFLPLVSVKVRIQGLVLMISGNILPPRNRLSSRNQHRLFHDLPHRLNPRPLHSPTPQQ